MASGLHWISTTPFRIFVDDLYNDVECKVFNPRTIPKYLHYSAGFLCWIPAHQKGLGKLYVESSQVRDHKISLCWFPVHGFGGSMLEYFAFTSFFQFMSRLFRCVYFLLMRQLCMDPIQHKNVPMFHHWWMGGQNPSIPPILLPKIYHFFQRSTVVAQRNPNGRNQKMHENTQACLVLRKSS